MPHEVLTPQALAQVLALDLYAAQARWQPYCFAGVSVPQREAQLLPLFISFLQPTVHGSGAGLHSARLVTGGSVVAPPSTPAAASGGSPVQTVHTSLHEVGAAAPQTSGSQHDVLVLPDVVQLQAPLRQGAAFTWSALMSCVDMGALQSRQTPSNRVAQPALAAPCSTRVFAASMSGANRRSCA